ncbi:hypothetical protein [Psychrobacter sp.]|uniref:hypothetical protein n=1 Tax=Psychrobacter sp. TaxID=56811 RepID=UPI0025F353E5|nr:hypothetical protein [Psychrobacter sp.]
MKILGFLNSDKKGSKLYSAALLISVLTGSLVMISCDETKKDPMLQTIPSNVENWEVKLGDTLDLLSEQDKQLLSRYMMRIQLSEAYEKGAMPNITIDKALEQQRQYELLHPANPTGRKNTVTQNTQQKDFSLILQPANITKSDSFSDVELAFLLTNKANVAIRSFKGTILLRYPSFKKPKPVVIPLTTFDPLIAPNNAQQLVANVSISDTNVMKAIQNPQNIEIVVTEGSLIFDDGREIKFE